MPKLYLATCAALPHLAPDDRPLVTALEALGLEPEVVVWDDPDVDWSTARLCVIRTVWDYHLKREAFLAWAGRLAETSRLLNPLALVRWNTEKSYLRTFEARGLPVVPTLWVGQGERLDLAAAIAERGWDEFVVKPVISASAYGTIRASRDDMPRAQDHLETLTASRGVMIQPYLRSVEGPGERSLVFIEGAYTHTARKVPVLAAEAADPDAVELITPDEDELALAQTVIASLDEPPLYARVDLIRGEAGMPMIMELELVEPSLFLDRAPEATARFAEAIARHWEAADRQPVGANHGVEPL